MHDVSSFEERFSLLLEQSGMTETALAEALGFSKQAVNFWRRGIRSPRSSAIKKIAAFFNVDIVWLMGYDVPPAPEVTPTRLPTSADEERLLTLWRNADDTIRPVVLELLELHPRPDAKKGEA